MKKSINFVLFAMLFLMSSCSVITGIFKAGVWTGILVVVLILGGIIALIARIGKK